MRIAQAILSVLLAVFLVTVTTATIPPGDAVATHRIDSSYKKVWAEKSIVPSPLSTDEEFLRRTYLDITGRVPTAEQALPFLNSKDPDKRKQLLWQLVNSREFAEYFASLWTAFVILPFNRNNA